LIAILVVNVFAVHRAFGAAAPGGMMLRIVIVEGEGATNNVRQRTTREPVVKVVDENNEPVSGATVLFLLPREGPGGFFGGHANELTVFTDENGRAVAHGLAPNGQTGPFRIEVHASHMDETASTVIRQSNISAGVISTKLLTLLAIGGGGAVAAAVTMGKGGSQGSSQPSNATVQKPTASITATPPSVGGPGR